MGTHANGCAAHSGYYYDSAAAEENPAPASANADTGRMESIILSASIMLTMRFFMISSPLPVDLSGYTPKRNSRNGQKRQVEYSTKIQGNKALLRAAPAKKWRKIMGKITIRGVCFSPIKKQFRNARRRFGTTNKNILSAFYAQSSAVRIPDRPALLLHLLCQKGRCHRHRLALGVLRAGGAVLGQ